MNWEAAPNAAVLELESEAGETSVVLSLMLLLPAAATDFTEEASFDVELCCCCLPCCVSKPLRLLCVRACSFERSARAAPARWFDVEVDEVDRSRRVATKSGTDRDC